MFAHPKSFPLSSGDDEESAAFSVARFFGRSPVLNTTHFRAWFMTYNIES